MHGRNKLRIGRQQGALTAGGLSQGGESMKKLILLAILAGLAW